MSQKNLKEQLYIYIATARKMLIHQCFKLPIGWLVYLPKVPIDFYLSKHFILKGLILRKLVFKVFWTFIIMLHVAGNTMRSFSNSF